MNLSQLRIIVSYKISRIISTNRLSAKTLVSNVENKPTSQIRFDKIFPNKLINRDKIYPLPQKAICKIKYTYDAFSIEY